MTMSRLPSGGNPQVTINSQTPTVELDAAGQPRDGYSVRFTTPRGVQGKVFVERPRYTPANVMAAVTEHANVLDAIDQVGKSS